MSAKSRHLLRQLAKTSFGHYQYFYQMDATISMLPLMCSSMVYSRSFLQDPCQHWPASGIEYMS